MIDIGWSIIDYNIIKNEKFDTKTDNSDIGLNNRVENIGVILI